MSTYFFVIFEVHYIVLRYNVCLEEYIDLSLRLEDTKPMRRTNMKGSQK